MIDAAAAGGDAAVLASVVAIAKKTNPDCVSEIDGEVKRLAAKADAEHRAKLASQPLFGGIKGEGVAGFSATSGNSSTLNITAGLKLTKESLHWKNALRLDADFERDNGVISDEKFLAAYEVNYKFSERFYAVGAAAWGRDTFQGYSARYTGALGLGYKLVNTPRLTISAEGGPSLRYTQYVSVLGAPGYDKTEVGGRAATNLAWKITPSTTFTQDSSAFVGDGDTLISNTALTTKLMGALSARASFLVQYESKPPLGLKTTDMTTRATLVYGF